MRQIALVSTGGTISSTEARRGEGAKPTLDSRQLERLLPSRSRQYKIIPVGFGKYSSQALDFALTLSLCRRIDDVVREQRADGVVVTMGTNTLEELSYFAECTLNLDCPLIFTGAMRHSTLPGTDSVFNLQDALTSACCDRLRAQGTVVVMNGQLHHSRFVAKVHTTSYSAFQSPGVGPMGSVTEGKVRLYYRVDREEVLELPEKIGARVDIIKFATGVDGSLLDASIKLGAKGIVVEGFGAGAVTPTAMDAIRKAVRRGIPVVLTSRCLAGELAHDGYESTGEDKDLARAGVIFADGYPSVKARIRLAIALSNGLAKDEIVHLFGSERACCLSDL